MFRKAKGPSSEDDSVVNYFDSRINDLFVEGDGAALASSEIGFLSAFTASEYAIPA